MSAQSPQDTKRQHPPQPQSVHTAAIWKKVQRYLLLYHQTTEQLLPPGSDKSQFIALLSTTPSNAMSYIRMLFLQCKNDNTFFLNLNIPLYFETFGLFPLVVHFNFMSPFLSSVLKHFSQTFILIFVVNSEKCLRQRWAQISRWWADMWMISKHTDSWRFLLEGRLSSPLSPSAAHGGTAFNGWVLKKLNIFWLQSVVQTYSIC